ncbi:MAG: PTS sugar transporter subunit IIA [Hyphomonadaceae bacterium]|nr:PTS sugar transporter subunit IIA [Hyphomonadaceae bacterium]
MTMKELIDEQCILVDIKASSKKQLIQDMAGCLIESGVMNVSSINLRDILFSAMERERLGSTGVGFGVALPHACIAGLDRIYGVFARVSPALDFESVDERPVDIVVLLVAPDDTSGMHLRALATASRELRREDMRERLRLAPTAESLYLALVGEPKADAT